MQKSALVALAVVLFAITVLVNLIATAIVPSKCSLVLCSGTQLASF